MFPTRKLITINFFAASILVWAAIWYARWKGISVDDFCMGFARGTRSFRLPAYVAPALIQTAFLAAYCAFRTFEEQNGQIRKSIASLSAIFLFSSWILPLISPTQSVWASAAHSYGIYIWVYAALSTILLAMGGDWEDHGAWL